MACEAQAQRVAEATQALKNAEAAARQPGSQRDENDPEIKAAQAELLGAQKALAECQANAPPPPPVVVAPREILDIVWTNPPPPDQRQPDWATQIVGGKGTFPANASFEWLQVLDPGQEYDDIPVGATGWVVQPDVASDDFYFSHPWGNDFEFFLALDVPREGHPEDVNYGTLLAPGNSVDVTNAGKLGVPTNVLGVEMEAPLVPGDVLRSIHEGDRAAVFGRWIIDTGHYFVSPPQLEKPPDPGFRAEIHPPILMATANVDPSTGATRAIFASRPYLTGQTFGSLDTIYQDGVDDNGPFYSHMKSEVTKVLADTSLSVEAHPKIKSKPFRGDHLFRVIVRPTLTPQRSPDLPPLHLAISFKFTVRTGCSVEVTTDGEAVNVWIAMDSAGYAPPQLPPRNEIVLTQDELTAPNASGAEAAESAFDEAHEAADLKLVLAGLAGITWGSLDSVQTDSYDAVSYNMLGRDGAVINATSANLVPGRGIVTDENQVYPVTGWLEVGWQAPPPVLSNAAPTTVIRARP